MLDVRAAIGKLKRRLSTATSPSHRKLNTMNALQILINGTRFDLVMKYACAAHRGVPTTFYKDLYLAQHGILTGSTPGETAWEDFCALCDRVQREGVPAGAITIGRNGEIVDGATELACAALYGQDVQVQEVQESVDYNSQWFLEQGLDRTYADYTAIEYVRLQPSALVVNLHSRVDIAHNKDVEAILRKHGMLYYMKPVVLSNDGYANIKKISYGTFWDRPLWIGNANDNFAGSRRHAQSSIGVDPLRAYVFVCDDTTNTARRAKEEVRRLFLGGNCIHINDLHPEAVRLAETYYNNNSLELINARPISHVDEAMDNELGHITKLAQETGASPLALCGTADATLRVLNAAPASGLIYPCVSAAQQSLSLPPTSPIVEPAEGSPISVAELVHHPRYYGFHCGYKFTALSLMEQTLADKKLVRRLRDRAAQNCSRAFIRKVEKVGCRQMVIGGKWRIVYKKRRKK